MSDRSWPGFCVFVLSLKALLLLLDPVPKFFFGDSSCFLYTAVDEWIPPDRSFAYGYVIRLVALRAGSLVPLLGLQTLASGISAILLASVLRRHFRVPSTVAYGLGILCAVEPLQLLYERYVLTEALTLFLLVLSVAAAFQYLETRQLRTLALIQGVGVAMVSFRISYLPIVFVNSVLIPVLALWTWDTSCRGPQVPPAPGEGRGVRNHCRRSRWLVHLAVSLGLTFVLHAGYKELYSALSGHPPGYHAARGYFLLASWAPVVEPQDFPVEGLRDRVFGNLAYELKDRAAREDHLFSFNGLIQRIRDALPWAEGDEVAAMTAMNALKRDPLGVAKLAVMTYLDYFDLHIVRARIANDLSLDQVEKYEEFQGVFAEFFSLPGDGVQPMTLTKQYYGVMLPWFWFLMLTPLVAAVAVIRRRGRERAMAGVVLVAACVYLVGTCALSTASVIRYLHPLAWLALCSLGICWPGTPANRRLAKETNSFTGGAS